MDEEAQFQVEYAKVLAMCGDTVLRDLAKDLCLADALHLEPFLRRLHVDLPWPAEEVSPIQQTAHRCARVIDWVTDQEWCPGSQDWGPLERQIRPMGKEGAPAALLTVTVLAARVMNARREELHEGWETSTATFVKSGREDEEDHTRLVRNITKSVDALRHKIYGKESFTNDEDLEAPRQIDGTRPFWPAHIRLWWQAHGSEFVTLLHGLDSSLEADRASFQARLSRLAQFTPGDGHREGSYPAVIYETFDMALALVSNWRKYGAVGVTRRLFGAVGIELQDDSIRKARQRTRKTPS